MASRRLRPRVLWALLAVIGLFVLPGAEAVLGGEIRYDLVSLGNADVEAKLELSGGVARDLRERTDNDDDGEVSSLEAAGAESFLADRFEGQTRAYTLDGNRYENERARVDAEGLEGPVDQEDPFRLEIDARAQAAIGQPPHTFALHGLAVNLTDEIEVVHEVRVPEGYAIADAEGFALVEDCNARTGPGNADARLAFEAREDACSRPIPAPGLPGLLVGTVLAVALARRRSPLARRRARCA